MKTIFILPPGYLTKQKAPPLGLAWLAAVILRGGLGEVSIMDMNAEEISLQELSGRLKKENPDVVGVTSTTWNRFEAFSVIKTAKEVADCVTMMGGPHVSFTAENTLRGVPDLDIVVRGEGEITVNQLITRLSERKDEPIHETVKGVRGISYRKGDKVVHEDPNTPIKDLDSLPFPARDLLPIDAYEMKIPFSDIISTSVMTKRGCPQGCVFCSTSYHWGRGVRFRSVENVLDELELLESSYGFEGFHFYDDTFTINQKWTMEFMEGLKRRGLNIAWVCEARANTLTDELVREMSKTGCRHVTVGAESGSPRMLKKINKGITVEQIVNAKNLLDKYNLRSKFFFMLSLPDEGPDDIKMTIDLMHKINSDEKFWSITRILPGTPIEKIAIEEGLFPKNFDWTADYSDPKADILGEEVLGISGSHIPIYLPKTLTIEEVKKAYLVPLLYSGLRKNLGRLISLSIEKGLVKSIGKMPKYLRYFGIPRRIRSD